MKAISGHPAKVLSVVISFVAVIMLTASASWAQLKSGPSSKGLVGTWVLVSNNVTFSDGKKILPFGENPVGSLMFDNGGRYSLQLCRAGRAKFASNNRVKGTPQEYQATVEGCNPHWGKYSVDGSAIIFNIEHAMFPNWEGIQQKRAFTMKGDDLQYTVPASSGGGVADVIWRRVK